MTKWTCAHGFGLSETCRQCDLVRAREVVARWGDEVDSARRLIGNRNLFNELMEGIEELGRIAGREA
jgi:hypothetical protein